SNYTTEMLLHSFSEQELNETRCLLEISMATDATRRLTDDDIEDIRALWVRIQAAAANNTIDVEADIDLHRAIMRRSDNRLIVAMLDAVYALAMRKRAGGEPSHRPENIQQ